MVNNIFISGVGGQGIITASRIISGAFFEAGFDVKKAEIHGLSQRGGSVVSQIRYGDKVFSPIIPKAKCEHVLSLEKMETLRYMELYNSKTRFVINDLKMLPITVSSGKFDYPENVKDILFSRGINDIKLIDADAMAKKEFSDSRMANTILIGVMSSSIDIDENNWISSIHKNIKNKYIEKNIQAFKLGKKYGVENVK
ncbi:MAG: indolepyruvate oxidoreductase subunit beta [Candidatus Muiribacterium halophilum]|uniref:Indolepyruvate oxidoreductase subunit beta n=1 Tax=Muiribacterium halophilum TaxID=2053465 RepID=A0A2N5ZBR1_MUIH1|nr:MAG: indolepyruvate oxidoreductase subunit beta [Candidatus Muirbacterium halophilum]